MFLLSFIFILLLLSFLSLFSFLSIYTHSLFLLHSQGCCFLQTEIHASLPLVTPHLLVSILISRGWRTMRPATFHPRVSSTLLSFLFVSFRLGNYSFRRVAAPSTPSHVEFFFFLSSSAIPRRSQRERTLRFCGFVSRI